MTSKRSNLVPLVALTAATTTTCLAYYYLQVKKREKEATTSKPPSDHEDNSTKSPSSVGGVDDVKTASRDLPQVGSELEDPPSLVNASMEEDSSGSLTPTAETAAKSDQKTIDAHVPQESESAKEVEQSHYQTGGSTDTTVDKTATSSGPEKSQTSHPELIKSGAENGTQTQQASSTGTGMNVLGKPDVPSDQAITTDAASSSAPASKEVEPPKLQESDIEKVAPTSEESSKETSATETTAPSSTQDPDHKPENSEVAPPNDSTATPSKTDIEKAGKNSSGTLFDSAILVDKEAMLSQDKQQSTTDAEKAASDAPPCKKVEEVENQGPPLSSPHEPKETSPATISGESASESSPSNPEDAVAEDSKSSPSGEKDVPTDTSSKEAEATFEDPSPNHDTEATEATAAKTLGDSTALKDEGAEKSLGEETSKQAQEATTLKTDPASKEPDEAVEQADPDATSKQQNEDTFVTEDNSTLPTAKAVAVGTDDNAEESLAAAAAAPEEEKTEEDKKKEEAESDLWNFLEKEIKQGRRCAGCDKEEGDGKFKPCAKCRAVLYCGRACQKKHWKAHKKVCCK